MQPLSKIFSIGDKVNVKAMDKSNKHIYVSQITDICEDEIIEISFPIHKNKTIYFINGEKLILVIGKQDAVFEFQAVVVEKKYENIPIMRLKVVSEPIRIQRRNFYRLKIVKPVEYRIINNLKDSEEEMPKYNEGVLLDISEGGLMFCTKKEMEESDLLELIIDIGINKGLKLKGIIVRKQYNADKSGLYEYGVRFSEINKKARNLLMKYIYEEQRKLLKKGML